MVGSDLDRVFGTPEVMSPILKRGDDGKEFFLVNAVVRFGTREFLGHIRDWTETLVVNWGQNCSHWVV